VSYNQPSNHDLKEIIMTPVTTEKFDELVASTTKYLQELINKNVELENRVAALENKASKRVAKDG